MATQPKLAMIPSGYKDDSPNGTLYSALPTDGAGDFDVTRGSDATRINKDGLIEAVTGNTPRLDYTGGGCPSLLLEPSSRNLITQSEAFGNSYWTKSGASVVGGFASPSASSPLGAFKLTSTSGATTGIIEISNIGWTSGVHTHSIYVKYIDRQFIQSFSPSFISTQYANFDLLNESVSGGAYISAGVDKLSNGFLRCWYTFTSSYTGNSAMDSISIIPTGTSSRGATFSGDVKSCYIFGAQLEQSSYATSYIPTSGSAQTRLADAANNAGDSSTFNDSEGVLMAEISALADDSNIEGISISDGSSSNRVVFFKWNSSNSIRGRVTSSGVNTLNHTINISDVTALNKIAIKYKLNDFAIWINGIKLFTDTSGSTPIGLNKLQFNSDGVGGARFYGKTKQLQYYNTALTDLELEKITSYTSFNAMALAQNYTI